VARVRDDSGLFTRIAGAQDVVVNHGPGALLGVIVKQAGTTVSIYDNTSGTGNPIGIIGAVTGPCLQNCRFTNGLHAL